MDQVCDQKPSPRLSASLVMLFVPLLMSSLTSCTPSEATTKPEDPAPSLAAATLGPTSTAAPTHTAQSPFTPTPTLFPIPTISSGDHTLGDADAPIRILVYSDFQCPFCADFHETWKIIEALHPGQTQFVFRHFPLLTLHDKADLAGAAAEIASQSGEFWPMHDALFDRQEQWRDLSREGFADWLIQLAAELDLDPTTFEQELKSPKWSEAMISAYQQGLQAGLPGTPFIFFNEEWYRLNPTTTNLEASIRLTLLNQNQYAEPPEIDLGEDTLYLAHFDLDRGEIVVQLLPEAAPATVASFIFLVEQGWYENIGFHDVSQGRLAETGDPSGTGLGGPGYLLLDELSDTLSFDTPGMLAMASEGPNTNGSRFFINLAPLPQLNGYRTIFGRVIEGLDLLSGLADRDPYLDLFEPYELVIESIRIEAR